MNKFYKSFQGIRGYAILLIFFSHCSFFLNSQGMNITTKWGSCGVELFIMLSGFLLMSQYEYREVNYWEYVSKKLRKVYPLHIVTLIVAIPFSLKLLAIFDLKTWFSLFCNLGLLQSFIPNQGVYFSFNSVAWYLSLNLFFIMIGPFLLKIGRRLNTTSALLVIIGAFIAEVVLCLLFFNNNYAHWILYVCPFVRTLDFIAGGGNICLFPKA